MNVPNLLFVYGSLKRGEVNFPVMIRVGAQFFAVGTTHRRLPIEQGPEWRRLLDRPGEGQRVTGELFVLESEEGWRQLDDFEGHPHSYRRRLEDVVVDETQQIRPAWIYFYVGD